MKTKIIVGVIIVMIMGGFLMGCTDKPTPVKEVVTWDVEAYKAEKAIADKKAYDEKYGTSEVEVITYKQDEVEEALELLHALSGDPKAIKDLAVEFIHSDEFLQDEETLAEQEEWEEDVEEVLTEVWDWLKE